MGEVFKARVGQIFAVSFPSMGVNAQFARRAVFSGPIDQGMDRAPIVIETHWEPGGDRIGGGLTLTGKVPEDAPPGLYQLQTFEQRRLSDGATSVTSAEDLQNAPELEILEAKRAGDFPEVRF